MRFGDSFLGVNALIAILMVVPVGFAGGQPTTAPVAQEATTHSTTPLTGRTTVLVLPFEVIGEDAVNRAWLGRAVQQNLLAELSRIQTLQPVTPSEAVDTPVTSPKTLATSASARFVVYGTVQSIGNDLRMTGVVYDAATQTVVTGLKATGSSRELFSMQDTLATQVSRALPAPVAKQTAAPVVAPEPNPPTPVRVAVDKRGFIGSDLDRAVRQGHVNRSPAVDVSDAHYHYTYGQSRWGYPIYGGYGWYGYNYPIVIVRDRSCYKNRFNLDVTFTGDNFRGRVTTGQPSPVAPVAPVMPPVVRGPNTVGYYPMTLQSVGAR